MNCSANEYNILMDACGFVGGGTFESFAALASQVSDDAYFSLEAMSTLSALGHVDVLLDRSSLRPQRWHMSEPIIATLPGDRAVLCGYRNERVIDSLSRACRSQGLELAPSGQDNGPTAYFMDSADERRLKMVCEAVSTEQQTSLRVSVNPALTLSRTLPKLTSTMPEMAKTQGIVEGDYFDPSSYKFGPNAAAIQDGLFRVTAGRMRMYLLKKGEEWYRVNYRVGKHLAAGIAGKSLLAYDSKGQLLKCPLGAPLPGLYERAAVLCSGTVPETDRQRGEIHYRGVPTEVASFIWQAMY